MTGDTELPPAERRRRQLGNIALTAGIGIFVIAAVASGWWEAEDANLAAASIRDLVMRTAFAIAIVCVIVGAVERANRPTRGMLHHINTRLDAQDQRAARVEDILADLAAVMPKEHAKQWWRGSVQSGLGLAATGTESTTSGDVLRLIRNRSSS